MLGRLRARATATLGLTWAGTFGVVGLSIALRAFLVARPTLRAVVVADIVRYAVAWGVVVGICGASFAIALMSLARNRTIERLPSLRICMVAGLVGFGIGATTDPGYRAASLLAIVAAGLAFVSLQMAKHARTDRERGEGRHRALSRRAHCAE